MVKTQFGIKDLENLSNVKAHTIRIWEKRYNLLEPDRTDTNIRKYDLANLKKLLNVSYLYNAGYKISKIAKLNADEIQQLINKNIQEVDSEYILSIFKGAMFEFDGNLFDTTLETLLEKKTFSEIYTDIFVPLLNEAGILWHSGTINPSHEHFISEKIRHCIIKNSIAIPKLNQKNTSKNFVLYLPHGEIHEIGILYANYELLSAGYNTVYLGENIPLDCLDSILKTKKDIVFITYFTVRPEKDQLESYLKDFQDSVCTVAPCELWILGRKAGKIKNKNFLFFNDLKSFTTQIENL